MDLDRAWRALDPRYRQALAQAWETFRRQGLPVGAVVSQGATIVGQGRNRVYDAPGGPDVLQRSPLAHAEMNAIAAVAEEVDLGTCQLWTTQRPCPMCQAAIDFTQIGEVHFLASDPSAVAPGQRFVGSGDAAAVWTVVADLLFLHGVARVAGVEHPFLQRATQAEGAIVQLARDLVQERRLIDAAAAGASLEHALTQIWERVVVIEGERKGDEAGPAR